MKTLLVFLAIFSSTHCFSQNLTFDETVKYINDIFSENEFFFYPSGSSTGKRAINISANKDGKVVIYNRKVTINNGQVTLDDTDKGGPIGTLNLFDIDEFILKSDFNAMVFHDKNANRLGSMTDVPGATANRIKKALEYLRSLCNKSLDPFAN